MTGPPYPRPKINNSIGNFVIGESPIGTIPPFDVWETIISQYANSPILTQLITNFYEYLDQTTNFENFFDLIMNVDTAQGYGLDVWGRIVGVSRVIPIANDEEFFGYQETGTVGSIQGFNTASFFQGNSITDNFSLSDSAFRTLIFAKALANISDGSIPAINQLLLNLFPHRGNCYVQDNGDMSIEYVFVFVLSSVELSIVSLTGLLPTPVGVTATIVTP